MGNPHMDAAKSRLHNGTTNEVARAAVEAQLAIVHEQRTANLLALLVAGHTAVRIVGVEDETLADAIKERLGL